MAQYLLIESRDPFESNDVGYFYNLAEGLLRDGNSVTLFLVQNGVLPARWGAANEGLAAAAAHGVKVLADDFSLRERGIEQGALKGGVQAGAIDEVVTLLAGGAKALWH